MTDVATLADNAVREAAQSPQPTEQTSTVIRKLFILMHGAYGNLFLSKFSTGEKDAQGKDKGVRAAMKIWDAALRKFPDDVLETAAGRLSQAHPQFPPNLPEFERLCDAAAPRKTYAQENNLPRLEAPAVEPVKVSFVAQNDGKDWARRILARAEAGDSIRTYTMESAQMALGMKGKQSWQ